MTRRYVLLLVGIAVVAGFPLGAARDLWVLDEVRYAAVVEDMHETGRWFAPHLNGEFYDHKPPLYFWLVGGATALVGGQSEFVLYVIAWLLSVACVIATFHFLRGLLPERTAWLASVVMLLSFLYQITTGIARMDLMMVAFMVLGQLAFVRGYTTDRRGLYAWFFVFCALAVLTKGPYGMLLPLVGVLVFLAWERRLREAVSAWFVGGFVIGLGIIGAWLAAVWAVEGAHAVELYVVWQTIGRMTGSWAHGEPFWYYAAWLPVEFLPWVAFVPCGFRLMRRAHPTAFRFLAAMAASNLVVISTVSCKIFVYILPIWPALAAAAAVRLRGAEGRGVEGKTRGLRIETTIAGALLVALGVAAAVLCRRYFPDKTGAIDPAAIVLAALGVVAIGAAWVPRIAVSKRVVVVGAVLLATSLAFSRLTALVVTPAFDDVMSPVAAGTTMREYAEKGYALAESGVPRGTYNYYARRLVIPTLSAAEVADFLDAYPRAVIAIRGTSLDEILPLPAGVRITGEHVLELKAHSLLVKEEATTD